MLTPEEIDDWELIDDKFEERAAIKQYEAGFAKWRAEQDAAQELGFPNKHVLKNWVQEMKALGGIK